MGKQSRQRDRMLERLEKKRRVAAAERKKIEAEEAAVKEQAMIRAKLEKERLEREGHNTEEVVASLQTQLESNLLQHRAQQDSKKQERKRRMQERLKAKSAKKALELKKAQQDEMREELREQEKERHELQAKSAKEIETKMLEGIMIRGTDENRIDEAIEIVMHDRHAKETSYLIAQQYDERTKVLRDAMEDLFERKANERAQILARVKEDNTSDVQLEATSALDKRHAEEQLALRQRQLSEISHAFEQLAPEDILKKKQAEQAQRQEEELREFKEAMDQEQKDQIERIKAEKEKFEEELRKKNEDEMRELESQHRKVMEEERVQAEKKIRERRAALLKEQELSQQNHMKRLGKLDEEEKKVLQQRFREDRERVAAALEAERLRQERALEEKLRVRRMKRALRKEELLRERMKLEHKRMQRRIEAVNSTMVSTVNAMMGKTVFKAAREKGMFSGENSAVQMSIVSKMANKWRNASLAAKAKAKADIAKLSEGTPAERRAAREVSKGFWKEESDTSNEESRIEQEKKANLEHVKKLQMKMEEELSKKGAEMSDRQRRQHERLLKKLELKKKRAAAKAEKLEKEKKKLWRLVKHKKLWKL